MLRIKINKCTYCLCRNCTAFYCQYAFKRCQICNNQEFRNTVNCDYFENVLTAPTRYHIKRVVKRGIDNINVKLDYIIANMGLSSPYVEVVGTYAVYFKGFEIYRGTKLETCNYVKAMQHEFSEVLKIKKLDIKL